MHKKTVDKGLITSSSEKMRLSLFLKTKIDGKAFQNLTAATEKAL